MTRLLARLREMVLGAECEDSNGTAPALMIKVRCAHCGEEITTRIEKAHALQEEYGPKPRDPQMPPPVTGYRLEKEILGEKCQKLLHLSMHFDPGRRPLKHEITGGTLLEITDHD